MIFMYQHPDGRVLERAFRVGHAPRRVRVAGAWCERALLAEGASKLGGRVATNLDFVSDQLDVNLHGKFHRGRIIKNEHGERKLHFSSRAEIRNLQAAWNASPDSEVHGKLRYGECDEFSDDVKRGHCRQ